MHQNNLLHQLCWSNCLDLGSRTFYLLLPAFQDMNVFTSLWIYFVATTSIHTVVILLHLVHIKFEILRQDCFYVFLTHS